MVVAQNLWIITSLSVSVSSSFILIWVQTHALDTECSPLLFDWLIVSVRLDFLLGGITYIYLWIRNRPEFGNRGLEISSNQDAKSLCREALSEKFFKLKSYSDRVRDSYAVFVGISILTEYLTW